MKVRIFASVAIALFAVAIAAGQQTPPAQPQQPAAGRGGGQEGQVLGPNGEVWGNTNLPIIPGTKWRIHDAERPQPTVVTAGATPFAPPSDAIVLFDGKDLSKWAMRINNEVVDAKWAVRDGYFESGTSGSIFTRDNFGDVQLHIEFATPSDVKGTSQGRGNSGVIFMGRYEIQVLDSFQNRTYADGTAAAIYGDWPPLVNVAKKPGEWQMYDIVFEAPKFSGDKLVSPAYFTVFWNGVLAHNRKPAAGPTSPLTVHQYTPHEAELPLTLQNHSNPVRFRNVWIRRLKGYDQ